MSSWDTSYGLQVKSYKLRVYLFTCLRVYLFTCLPVYLCTCFPVYDNCLRTSKKFGNVFETQDGFSIVTPSKRKPMRENAIAMRWSL